MQFLTSPFPMLPLPGKARLEHSRPSRQPRIPSEQPSGTALALPGAAEWELSQIPPQIPSHIPRLPGSLPFPASNRAQPQHLPRMKHPPDPAESGKDPEGPRGTGTEPGASRGSIRGIQGSFSHPDSGSCAWKRRRHAGRAGIHREPPLGPL